LDDSSSQDILRLLRKGNTTTALPMAPPVSSTSAFASAIASDDAIDGQVFFSAKRSFRSVNKSKLQSLANSMKSTGSGKAIIFRSDSNDGSNSNHGGGSSSRSNSNSNSNNGKQANKINKSDGNILFKQKAKADASQPGLFSFLSKNHFSQ